MNDNNQPASFSDPVRERLHKQLEALIQGEPIEQTSSALIDVLATTIAFGSETIEDAMAICFNVLPNLQTSLQLNWDRNKRIQAKVAAEGQMHQTPDTTM